MASISITTNGEKDTMLNTYYLDKPKNKDELVKIYAKLTANFSVAYNYIKQVHWNARGSSFIGFHKLLDKMGDNLLDYSDTCAELIAQMGKQVKMTPDDIDDLNCLPELSDDTGSVVDSAMELQKMYSCLSEMTYKAFNDAVELGDIGGSNAINDILTAVNKDGWFIVAQARMSL